MRLTKEQVDSLRHYSGAVVAWITLCALALAWALITSISVIAADPSLDGPEHEEHSVSPPPEPPESEVPSTAGTSAEHSAKLEATGECFDLSEFQAIETSDVPAKVAEMLALLPDRNESSPPRPSRLPEKSRPRPKPAAIADVFAPGDRTPVEPPPEKPHQKSTVGIEKAHSNVTDPTPTENSPSEDGPFLELDWDGSSLDLLLQDARRYGLVPAVYRGRVLVGGLTELDLLGGALVDSTIDLGGARNEAIRFRLSSAGHRSDTQLKLVFTSRSLRRFANDLQAQGVNIGIATGVVRGRLERRGESIRFRVLG